MQKSMNLEDIDCSPICEGQYFTRRAWVLEEDRRWLSIQYVQNSNIIYIIPIALIIFVMFFLPPLLQLPEMWRLCQILVTGAGIAGTIIWIAIDKVSARKGDWLIYDKELHTIELPRNKVTINIDSLVCLQIIIGDPNTTNSSFDTEVNIVFLDGSQYVRCPLMRAWTPRMIWRLVFELAKKLDCPRCKVEYTIFGECKKSEIVE